MIRNPEGAMHSRHRIKEQHYVSRIGWLRAAVLGANDGIISVSSLVAGVAASSADRGAVILTGVAALLAGALSMAAGEYVSVSSQADAEAADLARERSELHEFPADELDELKHIYVSRGLTPELAEQVARQLTQHDALGAHARDELGINDETQARPVQAALASALTFTSGGIVPIIVLAISPRDWTVWTVSTAALVMLAILGVLGARAGGADPVKGALRVTIWGALALAVTGVVGHLFGAA
jgi:VIT1/CCC1 family predicted Fe2+/Mn2+ transporter